MQDATRPRAVTRAQPKFAPASPSVAFVPGAVLLFLGLWLVTDGGPLPLGWAVFATGVTMVVLGAVAQGVAWGLAIHDLHRR